MLAAAATAYRWEALAPPEKRDRAVDERRSGPELRFRTVATVVPVPMASTVRRAAVGGYATASAKAATSGAGTANAYAFANAGLGGSPVWEAEEPAGVARLFNKASGSTVGGTLNLLQ